MKTPVCFTIDTEFTIGGSFNDPVNKKPVGEKAVWCRRDGQSHGLGFLLETFNQFNFNATFFVEALNTHYFGDNEMGEIAQHIHEKGHDVQLHLHPCWKHFKHDDWQGLLQTSHPDDSMANRNITELEELINEGIATFKRWNIPEPIALRTGNLNVDKNVYKAMASTGLKYASNIGLGVYQPESTKLHKYHGCHEIDGVMEVPIVSYRDINIGKFVHEKSMTIVGSSYGELVSLLKSAHKSNVGPIIILTHPAEFVSDEDLQYTQFKANSATQTRLANLCEYLQNNKDKYEVVTFKQGCNQWQVGDFSSEHMLTVPLWHTIGRVISNKLAS